MKQLLPGSGEKPLDRWLRELMPGKSWNEVRRLARTGKVFIDGAPLLDPTRLVRAGAELEFRQNAPRATRTPALPRSAILHLDAQLVVRPQPTEELRVAGTVARAARVDWDIVFSGQFEGSGRYRTWLDPVSGLPLQSIRTVDATGQTPIGRQRYVEHSTIAVEELAPGT